MGNFPAKKAYLFLENAATPLNPNDLLDAKHPSHKIHHVHTQKEIAVLVHFNGHDHHMKFSPATTVGKVLTWATTQFKIPEHDGTKVFLSIPGSAKHLQDEAHIGRFVPHDKNRLELNVNAPQAILAKI
jgi:hypothetical protein